MIAPQVTGPWDRETGGGVGTQSQNSACVHSAPHTQGENP